MTRDPRDQCEHVSSRSLKNRDLSSVLSQCTRLTDRQTDKSDGRTNRQTDKQTDSFLVASPRWHSMQRRKTMSTV